MISSIINITKYFICIERKFFYIASNIYTDETNISYFATLQRVWNWIVVSYVARRPSKNPQIDNN